MQTFGLARDLEYWAQEAEDSLSGLQRASSAGSCRVCKVLTDIEWRMQALRQDRITICNSFIRVIEGVLGILKRGSETIVSSRAGLHANDVSTTPMTLQARADSCTYSRDRKARTTFRGWHLTVKEPPEPDDVIWQNQACAFNNRSAV
jgi:hypothetical protein